VLLEAVNRDLDPEFNLLNTRFFCYYHVDATNSLLTDFSTPHVTVDFADNTASISGLVGNQTGTISSTRANSISDSFYLTADSTGDRFLYRIEFDVFGQSLFTRDLPALAGCFQSGASHERALHQFLLNTPEEGDFSCQVAQNGTLAAADTALTILDGNRYSYNATEGSYRYAEIFEGANSVVIFDTGALSGWEGQYTENPNNGLQEFKIASVDSDSAARCDRLRQPRPFKRYGTKIFEPPAASSVPLAGHYYLDDGNEASVGWTEILADGFINSEYPIPGATNCRRSLPNGLAPCFKYIYDGGNSITLIGPDGQGDVPISIGADGSVTSPAFGRLLPIRTPTNNELIGQWGIESFVEQTSVDVSLCIIGFCSSGASSLIYEFFTDGSFTSSSSSESLSTASTQEGNVATSSQRQSTESGTYQLNGPGIQLQYNSGQTEPLQYAHLINDDTLIIGYRVFQRVN